MIEFEISDDGQHDCLVVAFTGMGLGLGAIPFEFYRSVTAMDCGALFVRDVGRRWYQYFEPGELGPLDIVSEIERVRDLMGAKSVIMLGNSMGAFGALLCSCLTRTDAVMAFCPQSTTYIDQADKLGDDRYEAWKTLQGHHFGDLTNLRPAPGTDVQLIVGFDDGLDLAHSVRLACAWRCKVTIVIGAGHDVARVLKERGELQPIIEAACERARSQAAAKVVTVPEDPRYFSAPAEA